MKNNVLKTGFAALLLLLFSPGMMAQNDNKYLHTMESVYATFDGIKVSAFFRVIFTQGEHQSVKIEADEELINKITTKVKGGILNLDIKGDGNNSGRMTVYITNKDLISLEMSGASKFSSTNKIITPKLNLELTGISAATITADASIVKCNVFGVSKLDLQGTGEQLSADISGTAKLLASKFEVKEAKINTSGVGSATVNASKSVSLEASGASNIKYIPYDNLEVKNKSVSGASRITSIGGETTEQANEDLNEDLNKNLNRHLNKHINTNIQAQVSTNGDSTKVRVGKLDIEVIDGPQTEVRLGNNKLIVDDNGKVQYFKNKRPNSFHSHWAGFYIGVNGYLTPSGRIEPPVHDNFMSLNLIKSTNFQFNVFEQNLKIGPNAGFVTGIGIDYRNYQFDHKNVVLQSGADYFDGILDPVNNYKKSKLLVTYLTVPLLFELQTNRYANWNSFHIAGGVSSGLRIGSHSKVKFDKPNGGTEKSKDRNDFNLNPFKLDATVLIGWGAFNIFGTYGLIDMFKMDKGPELRTFSIGIRSLFD